MILGIDVEHDEFRVYMSPAVTVSSSGGDDETASGAKEIYSQWCPNTTDLNPGIWLRFETHHVPAGSPDKYHLYRLRIPDLSYDRTETTNGSYGDGTDSMVVMRGVRVSTVLLLGLPVWELTFTEIEWFIGGVSVEVIPGDTITGEWYTAAGVPIIGLPPTHASGGGNRGLYANWSSLGPNDVLDLNLTLSVAGTAGWDWGEDTAFPVLLDRLAMPINNCVVGASAPTISASSTSSSTVGGYYSKVTMPIDYGVVACEECAPGTGPLVEPGSYEPEGCFVHEESADAKIMLIPAVDRAYIRMGIDYGSLVKRYGFPAADANSRVLCESQVRENSCSSEVPYVANNFLDNERYYDPASDFLGIMTASASAVENPMAGVAKAPYFESFGATEFKTFIPGAPTTPGKCGPGPLYASVSCCFEGNHYRYDSTSVGAFAFSQSGFFTITFPLAGYDPGLIHEEEIVNYFNFHCNPHWMFYLYFALDCEAEGWVIEDSDSYHIPIRSQYLHQPSLQQPTPRTRNHVVAEPLDRGQLATYIAAAKMGTLTSWLGISRFEVASALPDAERTFDENSETLWSLTDCTGVFDTGSVELTSTAGTTISAKVPLQNFEQVPFNYGEIAKSIELDWEATNIDSVSVYLENQDGASVLLATAPGEYDKPIDAEDDVFVGSWAQDFGVGVVSDTGVDVGAGGVSAATLADALKVHAYELFGCMTATYIRFDIELTSAASPCTISYPIFHRSADVPHNVQESGQFASLIYPNGAMIRFGQHDHWDDGDEQLEDIPTVRIPGELATEPDGLAWIDHYCKGDPLGTTSTPWHADEYADDEDRTIGTHAFILPMALDNTLARTDLITPRIALVNSLRECPPLVIDPRKKRDATWAETGEYGLWSYTYCQNAHKLLSAKQPLKMYEVSSGTEWSSAIVSIPNYFITDVKHAVQQTEAPADFELRVGDEVFGNATPWRGCAFAGARGQAGEGIAITRDDFNNHMIAFIDVDGLKVRTTNFKTRDDVGLVTSDPAFNPGICWLTKECCIVLYDDGTDLFASFNYARGTPGYWSSAPLTIKENATNGFPLTDPVTGMTWFFYWTGTDFEVIRFDNLQDILDLNFDGPFTIATEPEGRISAVLGGSSEKWMLAMFTNSLGDQEALFSYNLGEDWG